MNWENSGPAYRLAFIDLDDTLLGPKKEIGPENLGALARLRAAGIQIAIASGRHHYNIAGLAHLGPKEWILSSHGSIVRHDQTGEVLAEVNMAPELVTHLCQRGRDLGFAVIVYHRDGAFIERPSPWVDLYAREAGWNPQQTAFATLDTAGIQKVLWSDEPARIKQWAPVLQAEFAGRLNVLITNPELLEFFSPVVNKAVGAQTLAEKLGIAPAETLAFGDGNNDVEMLRWAGLSVAMDHGRETARQAARHIAPPGPPESAFARAVELSFGAMR